MISSLPESAAPGIRHVATPLGNVAVPDAQLLYFNDGVRGFQSFKSWVLLGGEAADTVWLQSIDEPALALLLIDPFATFEGFTLDVPATAVAALGATQSDDLLVFAPVTLGHSEAPTTANLRGLILINWNTHRGMQLIVDGGPWSVREVIRG